MRTVLWLGAGILGDDTDGHVDDLARFFGESGIVTAVERDPRDPNHRALAENLERLRALRTPSGGRFSIAELPMPAARAVPGPAGCRRPTRTSSSSTGRSSCRPSASPGATGEAQEVLASCFPGREVVPIDCLELVWGLGTLHCISQQQPASNP